MASARAFIHDGVHRLRGWRWLVAQGAIAGLRLYYKTLRWQWPENLAAWQKRWEQPCLIVVWHNRSLLAPYFLPYLFGRDRVHCLISPSKKAAWEVALFEAVGLPVIRGSSSRRGLHATREMLQAIKNGDHAALSPDGPSGPLYTVKKGAVMMARKADVPVYLIHATSPRAHRLKTWDRHLVPWPGQKVTLTARALPCYSEQPWDDDAAQAQKWETEFLAELGE